MAGRHMTASELKPDATLQETVRSTEDLPAGGDLYVQYGCGLCAPMGWVNFDASPNLRLQRLPVARFVFGQMKPVFPAGVRYGDIVRGLPLPADSCQGVYASHILEHLTFDEINIALQETLRILRPGGVFRVIVPDLFLLASTYVKSAEQGDAYASHAFMAESFLGHKSRSRTFLAFLSDWLGNSRHLWMWDCFSLTAKLSDSGFVQVRPAAFGDCDDLRFKEVEDEGRFVDACALEARKPFAP